MKSLVAWALGLSGIGASGALFLPLGTVTSAVDTTAPSFEVQAIYNQPLWDYILIRTRASEPVKDISVTVTVSTQGSKSHTAPVSMTAILGETVFEGKFVAEKSWGNIGAIVMTASDLDGNQGRSDGAFERLRITVQDAKTQGDLKKLVEELNRMNRLTGGPLTLKEIVLTGSGLRNAVLDLSGNVKAIITQDELTLLDSGGRAFKSFSRTNHFILPIPSALGSYYSIVKKMQQDPNGNFSYQEPTMVVVNDTGEILGEFKYPAETVRAISERDGLVVCTNDSGKVFFINPINGERVEYQLLPRATGSAISISQDGNYAVVSMNYPGPLESRPRKSVLAVFRMTGELVWRKEIDRRQGQPVASSAGSYLNVSGFLVSKEGTVLNDSIYHTYGTFSEDENRFAGTDLGIIRMWDTNSGEVIFTMPYANEDVAFDVATSQDGTISLAGSVKGRFPNQFDREMWAISGSEVIGRFRIPGPFRPTSELKLEGKVALFGQGDSLFRFELPAP